MNEADRLRLEEQEARESELARMKSYSGNRIQKYGSNNTQLRVNQPKPFLGFNYEDVEKFLKELDDYWKVMNTPEEEKKLLFGQANSETYPDTKTGKRR